MSNALLLDTDVARLSFQKQPSRERLPPVRGRPAADAGVCIGRGVVQVDAQTSLGAKESRAARELAAPLCNRSIRPRPRMGLGTSRCHLRRRRPADGALRCLDRGRRFASRHTVVDEQLEALRGRRVALSAATAANIAPLNRGHSVNTRMRLLRANSLCDAEDSAVFVTDSAVVWPMWPDTTLDGL